MSQPTVPRLDVVRKPYALPPPPDSAFVVLDVAFAGGKGIEQTHAFIERAGERLKLWVDHHEHAQAWPRYLGDPRFVLVPSRTAPACPELVTPELVARAGAVERVLAHHDFDGLMSAVRFLAGGVEPYPGADEDARAADSPGRGFRMSPRGERLAAALSQATSELDEPAFAVFYRAVAESLLAGREEGSLAARVDQYARAGESVRARAQNLAAAKRLEAPGVCVVRLDARLDGRMRLALLALLQESAPVGLILEGSQKRYWATAATYHGAIALEELADLNRGRHDLRFGPTKDADGLIAKLSALARAAELA